MKLKKERLLQIIKEELFYRDFYRASKTTALREQPELEMMPPEEAAMSEMPPEEEKLTQQQKYVQRGVETVRLSPEDYKQMIYDVLMSPKVYEADRKNVFYEIFGTNFGPKILTNIRKLIKAQTGPQ